MQDGSHIGRPTSRVDGRVKVTGAARYAAEYDAKDLLHGVIVSASIAAGHVRAIHTEEARAVSGVVEIYTHENRGKAAWLDRSWRDETSPPGHPFRPLHSDRILYDGQPIALVVAETYEAARDAATLVRADYDRARHCTDLGMARAKSFVPSEIRNGISPSPRPRGDAEAAFQNAPFKLRQEYRIEAHHHSPMELYATTCVWEGKGKVTIYDKTQGAQNSQAYVAQVFRLKPGNVRVINRYVGGAFGSGLRPHVQLFLSVMASLELKRSVRVSLTRAQMFHIGYRPDNIQTVALAADREGKLQAIMHDAIASTSDFEEYQEVVVNWSGMLYHCDNVRLSYELAKLDTFTPCDMRAPGATSGVAPLEIAMDELAYATGIDPVELRQRNFSSKDENEDKPYTSKALLDCYREGAAAFGWQKRTPAPGSMREGNDLIGWGMATGVWDAMFVKAEAKARLAPDGRIAAWAAASDIGTGTLTILTQIAADAFGVPLDSVEVHIGDSTLPTTAVEGGSWTAASSGAAVQAACDKVKKTLFKHAKKMANSPLADARYPDVDVKAGRIALKSDPGRGLAIAEVMHVAGLDGIEEKGKATPNPQMTKYASNTHSAVFAEVRVDDELGVARVTRIVCAVAAGRILNPKTARSQILGGVVMGIGMALHEEAMTDHGLGRIMNANIAEYHVPVHADIADIEVIFVEEHDEKTSPLGVKGVGEIGIVGTAAAVANAIFHATGKRVRELPITLDKLLG
jgi:xanthine dehydrogenase YagR molybdenum-binding subunit